MKKYIAFDKIESEYPLAELLNKSMSSLNILRMSSAPRSYSSDRLMHCPLYYELCLWETYCHELYNDLVRMRAMLVEYLFDFNSDWLEYARFQRNKFVGEGSTQEEEELSYFSVLFMLKREEEVCITRDTSVGALNTIFGVLKECTQHDLISELSKITGKKIQPYKINEEGIAVPIGQAERQFNSIKRELETEDMVEQIKKVVIGIKGIYTNLSKLPEERANEAALTAILERVEELLNLNWQLYTT